ncbi:MAG TPA: bifunctional phosphoribosylaminoimidazolecarboxamide formyltransferase/IMP cyclohydrolase [Ktedonobacterales bacterium]
MRAIISVADKSGIIEFARGLSALDVEIISTGGTASTLTEAGIPVQAVAEVTGFPEILGGRVKTLHPAIAGGILARRAVPGDMRELSEHQITPIDLVVCNLYPFAQAIARNAPHEQLIEEIDIGGVTLLREAAKNYVDVSVVVRPQDYDMVLMAIREHGTPSLEARRQLAAVAFSHTAYYDSLIADYMRLGTSEALLPEYLTLGLQRIQPLRYGENPHQYAAFYAWGNATHAAPASNGNHGAAVASVPTVASAQVLHGKELSYNNLLDLDAALAAVASFTSPATVIVKHTNPCGLACSDTLVESYRRAHAGDPISAYGGIIGVNREVDAATAAELGSVFYEAIIAPGFTDEALDLLRKKKNIRLLATGMEIGPSAMSANAVDPYRLDFRRVSGGILAQTADIISDQDVTCEVVTERKPTFEETTDLLFAWKAVRHVKSNAIVLAQRLMIVGVGAGQTYRAASVQIAIDRAADRARGAVLASDAYFPFADGVELAAKAGVTAVIQPGGSIRDEEVIRAANRNMMAMIFTGQRHFRH